MSQKITSNMSKDQVKELMQRLLTQFLKMCKADCVIAPGEIAALDAFSNSKAFHEDIASLGITLPELMSNLEKSGPGKTFEDEFNIGLSFSAKLLLASHVTNKRDLETLVCMVKIFWEFQSPRMRITASNLVQMFEKGWPQHQAFVDFREGERNMGISLIDMYRVYEQMEYSEACIKLAKDHQSERA